MLTQQMNEKRSKLTSSIIKWFQLQQIMTTHCHPSPVNVKLLASRMKKYAHIDDE